MKKRGEVVVEKFKKIGIIILAFFIIGFLMSFLIHSGLWNKLIMGFKSINIFLAILLILIFFFLVILIHELGHLFSFLANGIKIRALYVLCFIFKRTKKGFKFEIYLPFLKLLGGIVVPELPNIRNDEEYKTVKTKFSKALIAGPMISLYYSILVTILFILSWTLTNNSFLIGFTACYFIITFLLTIIVMLSSKIHTNEIYGDFIAYKKMKDDELFQLNQIVQYITFRLEEDLLTTNYLIKRMEDYIKNNNVSYDLFSINLYSQYLNIILFKEDISVSNEIINKIEEYKINRLILNKHGLDLGYLIASLYYKINDLNKSFELYEILKKNKNRHHKEEDKELLRKQYAHLMNLEDHTNELMKEENVFKDEMWILKPIFDKDELINSHIKKLPFKEYYVELYNDIEKNDTN